MAPATKQSGTSRQRAPSSLSQVATPPSSSAKSRRASKPSLVVKLKLPPTVLAQFNPVEPKATKKASRTPSSAGPTILLEKAASDTSDQGKGSDEAQTPQQASTEDGTELKAGVKREHGTGTASDDKKMRPIQRKRPKV